MPPKGWFRLSPGAEVRLKEAYLVTCGQVVKDPATGEMVELHCTYDPETRGRDPTDGRRVKGTLHWVSAAHAIPAEVRLYDRLFAKPDPDDVPEGEDFTANLNPDSLETLTGLLGRAWPGRDRAGNVAAVYAPGLLRRRPRLDRGPAGVQPHDLAARHLGEDAGREEVEHRAPRG